MQNSLANNRTGALMTILVLAVGSVSIVGTNTLGHGRHRSSNQKQ